MYGLFKPSGIPFYIGKGKGNRINNHFSPSQLKKNTRKSNFIKKYPDQISRQILSYFDKEEDAYLFENWLINQYGLIDEGGVLYNYSKSLGNSDYSYSFAKDVSQKAYKEDANHFKYTQDQVVNVYRLYFEQGIIGDKLEQLSGIPKDYCYYLTKGIKHKRYFSKWVLSGLIKNNIESLFSKEHLKSKACRGLECRVSDETLQSLYFAVCSGETTIRDLCNKYNFSANYIRAVFQGQKRKYLGFRLSRDTIRECRGFPSSLLIEILNKVRSGQSVNTLAKEYNIPKTTLHRSVNSFYDRDLSQEILTLKIKLKTGLNNGTGQSNGSSGDSSSGNNENK